MITLEIACNNYTSCENAFRGGANRIELFSDLHEGGCTPSFGMIQMVKKNISLPLYVMIRPRGGNFNYSENEIEIMLSDIELCKSLNVDGIVFGLLNSDGTVDIQNCRRLLQAWDHQPATFHRAIDRSEDIFKAAETIIGMGFERILTSGGRINVTEGLPVIQELQQGYGKNIEIMPGGGVTIENLNHIINESKVQSIHGTFKNKVVAIEAHSQNRFNDAEQFSSLEEIKTVRNLLNVFTGKKES